jgi:toxoflavin synthase
MATDYDLIAEQYKEAKRQPWRLHVEHYTLFELLGDLRGQAVLDLACGEGFYTRRLRQAGAGRVLGVDLSAEMVRLGREEEARRPLGVEYRVGDAKDVRLGERFDVVVAAYLLNYAASARQLLAMCRGIAAALKPGGRFVTVNNNPAQPPEHFPEGAKYGFRKAGPGRLIEGEPVTWTFFLEDGPLKITNYYLSVPTHERVLAEAGLRDVRWHRPQVSPGGVAASGRDYWASFLSHPPAIFLEGTRAPWEG